MNAKKVIVVLLAVVVFIFMATPVIGIAFDFPEEMVMKIYAVSGSLVLAAGVTFLAYGLWGEMR